MPPPEPRSSTVSPAFSSASAVGLPQPSEASSAVSGTWPASTASYRLEVIGSTAPIAAGAAPQQLLTGPQQPALALSLTRRAASPYFSRTTCLTSGFIARSLGVGWGESAAAGSAAAGRWRAA